MLTQWVHKVHMPTSSWSRVCHPLLRQQSDDQYYQNWVKSRLWYWITCKHKSELTKLIKRKTNNFTILTRKATWPNAAENDTSTWPPNLTAASCDLELWPPDPKVDRFMRLASALLVAICITLVHSLSKYHVYNFVTEQTKRQVDNITPPASLQPVGGIKMVQKKYKKLFLLISYKIEENACKFSWCRWLNCSKIVWN